MENKEQKEDKGIMWLLGYVLIMLIISLLSYSYKLFLFLLAAGLIAYLLHGKMSINKIRIILARSFGKINLLVVIAVLLFIIIILNFIETPRLNHWCLKSSNYFNYCKETNKLWTWK